MRQNSYTGDDGWKLWEQPVVNPDWEQERYANSIYYFWGAEAAQRQGTEAFTRFHLALLASRYVEPIRKLYTRADIIGLAGEVGLDVPQFERDFADLSCLDQLATDHQHAESLNIFGTPTIVFTGDQAVYVKLDRVPDPAESLDFWQVFSSTALERPYVLEMKRP